MTISRPRYINAYVKMELARGYIDNLIQFYFTLDLPNIQTVEDGMES